MNLDLRKTALDTSAELDRLAEGFPLRSPGRKALKLAAWRLKVHYIFGTSQKRKILLLHIQNGARRIDELAGITGIDRREVADLLKELVEAGRISETMEKPAGDKGGRKFRSYRIVLR